MPPIVHSSPSNPLSGHHGHVVGHQRYTPTVISPVKIHYRTYGSCFRHMKQYKALVFWPRLWRTEADFVRYQVVYLPSFLRVLSDPRIWPALAVKFKFFDDPSAKALIIKSAGGLKWLISHLAVHTTVWKRSNDYFLTFPFILGTSDTDIVKTAVGEDETHTISVRRAPCGLNMPHTLHVEKKWRKWPHDPKSIP